MSLAVFVKHSPIVQENHDRLNLQILLLTTFTKTLSDILIEYDAWGINEKCFRFWLLFIL